MGRKVKVLPEHTSAVKSGRGRARQRPPRPPPHGQRRAPQECLKVKDRDESERAAVCQSSQMAADTATRALRPDKGRGGMGGSNLPRASVIGAHTSPVSPQTAAVSPHLQKHAPPSGADISGSRIIITPPPPPPPPAHHGGGGGAE